MHHQSAFPSSALPATEQLTCPQCGRDAFQIFRCPERKHDACPFVQQWRGRKSGAILGILVGTFVLGWCAATLVKWEWVFVIVMAVGLLSWLGTIDLQLYKPGSGMLLERTSFFGLPIRTCVMKKEQAVSLPFKPDLLPRYPLSTVALGRMSNSTEEEYRATCVVRAALLELLIRDLIAIQPVSIRILRKKGTAREKSTDICVMRRLEAPDALKLGRLETAILRALKSRCGPLAGRDGWLDGLRVYDLVCAYLENDRIEPYGDLLCSVEDDAASRSLCTVEKHGLFGTQRRVAWGASWLEETQAESKLLDDLEGQLTRAYPELWIGLGSEISKGLKSHLDSGA